MATHPQSIASALNSKNFKLFHRNKDRLKQEISTFVLLVIVLIAFGATSKSEGISVVQGPQTFPPQEYTPNSTLTSCGRYGFKSPSDPCFVYFGDSEMGCSNELSDLIASSMSWCNVAKNIAEMEEFYTKNSYVVPICSCANTTNFNNITWAAENNAAVAIEIHLKDFGKYTVHGPSVGFHANSASSNVQAYVKAVSAAVTLLNPSLIPWQVAIDSALLGRDISVTVDYFPQKGFSIESVATMTMVPLYATMLMTYSLMAVASEMCKEGKGGMKHALFTMGLGPLTYWWSWTRLLLVRLAVTAIPLVWIFKKVLVTTTDWNVLVAIFALFSLWATCLVLLSALLGVDPESVTYLITMAPSIMGGLSYMYTPLFTEPSYAIPVPGWVSILLAWLMPPLAFAQGMCIALYNVEVGTKLSFATAGAMTPFGFTFQDVIIPLAVNVLVWGFACLRMMVGTVFGVSATLPQTSGVMMRTNNPLGTVSVSSSSSSSSSSGGGGGSDGGNTNTSPQRHKRLGSQRGRTASDGGIELAVIGTPEEEEEQGDSARVLSSDNAVAVSIRDLRKYFTKADGKELKAVDGLSVDFYSNQITSFLGHNGAGKSTTISLLTGLFPPDGGDAFIQGHSVKADMSKIRELIGVCPQTNVCWDLLTVEDHLRLFAVIRRMEPGDADAQIDELLADVGLVDKKDTFAKELSGGQKRKLCTAMALIGDPKIVFLDEPTAGMDSSARRDMWELLLRKKAGRCIILCTHMMDEADVLGDRVAVLSAGKLQVAATPTELKCRYGKGYHLDIAVRAGTDRRQVLALVEENGGRGARIDLKDFFDDAEERAVADEEALLARDGGDLRLIVPRDADIASVFEALELARAGAGVGSGTMDGSDVVRGIEDFGVNGTNLEDVFWELGQLAENQADELPFQSEDFPSNEPPRQDNCADSGSTNNDNNNSYSIGASYGRLRTQKIPEYHNLTPPSSLKKVTIMVCRQWLAYWRSWKENARKLISFVAGLTVAVVVLSTPVKLDLNGVGAINFSATGVPFSQVRSPFLVPFDGPEPVGGMIVALTQWSSSNERLPRPYNATAVSPCLEAWLMDSMDVVLCSNGNVSMTPTSPNQPQPINHPGAAGAFKFPRISANKWDITYNYTVLSNQSIAWAMPGLINFANNGIYFAQNGYSSVDPVLRFEYSQWQRGPSEAAVFYTRVIVATILSSVGLYVFFISLISVTAQQAAALVHDVNTQVKQMQILMGATKFEYLLSRYVFDFGLFCIILAVPLILVFALRSTLASGTTLLMLVLYYFSMRPIVHFLAKFFQEPSAAFSIIHGLLVACFLVMFVVSCALYGVFIFDTKDDGMRPGEIADFVFMLYPPVALAVGLRGVIFASVLNYGPLLLRGPSNHLNVHLPTAAWPCVYLFLEVLGYNILFIWLEYKRSAPFDACMNCFSQYCCRCVCIDACYTDMDPTRPRHQLQRPRAVPNDDEGDDAEHFDVNQFEQHEIEDDDVRTERTRAQALEAVLLGRAEQGWTSHHGNFDTSTRSTAHIAMLDLGSQEVTQAEADEIALLTVGVYKEYYPSGLQRYQGTVALKDFSLAIKKRECFSLLGSNGAGKSTMMNILLKQVEATRGKVYVFGQELFQIDEATHCSLSYCPQTNALFDTLTTMECLEFYCRIRGIGESEIEAYVGALMAAADLQDHVNTWCGDLSGGNKRKLSLAIALIGTPSLVVLDEPSAGVDPAARRKLHWLINAAKRRGATVLLTTHHMDEAASLGDRVAIMVQGFMVCLGSVQHLLRSYNAGYVLTIVAWSGFPVKTHVLPWIADLCPQMKVMRQSGEHFCSLSLGDSDGFSLSQLYRLLTGMRSENIVNYFSCGQGRLEDVFLQITEKFIKCAH